MSLLCYDHCLSSAMLRSLTLLSICVLCMCITLEKFQHAPPARHAVRPPQQSGSTLAQSLPTEPRVHVPYRACPEGTLAVLTRYIVYIAVFFFFFFFSWHTLLERCRVHHRSPVIREWLPSSMQTDRQIFNDFRSTSISSAWRLTMKISLF